MGLPSRAALPQEPLTPLPDRLLGTGMRAACLDGVLIYPPGIPGSAEPLFHPLCSTPLRAQVSAFGAGCTGSLSLPLGHYDSWLSARWALFVHDTHARLVCYPAAQLVALLMGSEPGRHRERQRQRGTKPRCRIGGASLHRSLFVCLFGGHMSSVCCSVNTCVYIGART